MGGGVVFVVHTRFRVGEGGVFRLDPSLKEGSSYHHEG
jgi:hypothetical protein